MAENLNPPVIPDKLYGMSVTYGGEELKFAVSPKYDHVEHWHRFGQWALKILDDERGMMTMLVDEATATRVVDIAGLGILVRDQITESEYDCYLDAQEKQLDDSWLNDS